MTNAMGFMRMTTFFNVKPRDEVDYRMTSPERGSYPFHVLLIIPPSQNMLRGKFRNSMKPGRYLQHDGQKYSFSGHFVGMLKTRLLMDCPDHIRIPVIVVREVNRFSGTQSGGTSALSKSVSGSPSKSRWHQTPTKDGESSSQAGPTSPTPTSKARAKAKERMKRKALASWQNGPLTDSTAHGQNTRHGFDGSASEPAPQTGETDAAAPNNTQQPPNNDLGSTEASQQPEGRSDANTTEDKGKGKAPADDTSADAEGPSSAPAPRKRARKN